MGGRFFRGVTVACLVVASNAHAAGNASGFATGDPVKGAALYQARCSACHSIDYNGVGPAHRGVVGRGAALAPGYAYSLALKKSGLVWNEQSLDRWLNSPEALVPGQRMGVSVADPVERADLIAYLKQASLPR